ncbi:patatin-like phospholipase family protein [bacterium]|nr:patatin-like phospholipase family protein [bacterium]
MSVNKNNKKFVLYSGGGTMSGIFGAGVVTAFQEMDIYDRIEAIYGGSAGAINVAYFLSRQTHIGSSIYYENLIYGFIYKKNFIKALTQRISGIFRKIPMKKMMDIVDIEYLFDVIKHSPSKKLDVKKIRKQPIPFYIRVYNLTKDKIEYLDIKKYRNPYKVLKASVDVIPYTSDSERIDGEEYTDGTILNHVDLGYLIKQYPQKKIVVVLNHHLNRKFRHYVQGFLEGLMAISIYGSKAVGLFFKAEFQLRKDIKLAKKNKRILLISPSADNPTNPSTTDSKKLKITYQMGKDAAQRIRKFVD